MYLAIVSPAHLDAGTPVLLAIVALVDLLAVALISGGIWLIHKGRTANTEIDLFGATLRSQSVGVVGIFCGAVLAILVLYQVLKATAKLGAIPD
jgi:hypothetical protein